MTGREVELFVPLDDAARDDPAALVERVALATGIPRREIASVRLVRRSLDARKGRPPGWHLKVAVARIGEPAPSPPPGLPPPARAPRPLSVVVVGAGPAGTFAALRLAQAGVT